MREQEPANFYAHSAKDRANWEHLKAHLLRVSERAGGFAAAFQAKGAAEASGLLHDIGKYAASFLLRLEGRASGLDHWSVGAFLALRTYKRDGIPIALAVEGHHVGLQDGSVPSLGRLDPKNAGQARGGRTRWTETDVDLVCKRFQNDGLALPDAGTGLGAERENTSFMLDVRMLFSALVDADFIETEAHFKGEEQGHLKYRQQGPALEAERALKLLLSRISNLKVGTSATPGVRAVREDLLAACLSRGEADQGIFTLTAPTGSGKTLSMLAFALRHAARHGLRRVILAIPYLTIIEQTAHVYRDIFETEFGSEYIVEDHSLARAGGGAGPDAEDHRQTSRLLAENWDAPIVLTTNVRILESLFSDRSSACRRLHRLAQSVILFDEVQTLPAHLAIPTLAAVSSLNRPRYATSIVFATATQPAFDHLDSPVRELVQTGWSPTEIVSSACLLFARSKRTEVRWELKAAESWDALAAAVMTSMRVLCVVNLKRHAIALLDSLKRAGAEPLFHLSTNMCPAHRTDVLAKVKLRLEKAQPCILISTQCVEAGVDIDFPVVFRAVAPLEAIAQAGGRCNRNGSPTGSLGQLVVFRPPPDGDRRQYPSAEYGQAAQVTEMLLLDSATGLDLDDPATFRRYYTTLYDMAKVADSKRSRELRNAITAKSFPEVARLYRLIPDDTVSVLVPYSLETWRSLAQEVQTRGRLTADWIRRAQPHSVSVSRAFPDGMGGLGAVPVSSAELSDEWFLCHEESLYDRNLLGFLGPSNLWIA
jgi:CRISPR-associated helicase Cas3/CRISPR-associated endonuclease Cas3-HD